MPLAEINWTEILSGRGGESVVALGVFALAGIVGVTAIVAIFWHKARLIRLKEQMIDRGFSAQEITAVINAGEEQGRASKAPSPLSTNPANVPDGRKAATN